MTDTQSHNTQVYINVCLACLDNYAAEGLRTSLNASDVVAGCDIIVIAVKPYTVST